MCAIIKNAMANMSILYITIELVNTPTEPQLYLTNIPKLLVSIRPSDP